ncbi:MAG: hypothetical protein ACFCUE_08295 [Candidatus Bathyarchaeia archaeon]|jgi:hypothetical protein
MTQKSVVAVLLIALLVGTLCLFNSNGVSAETFDGWQHTNSGGVVSEEDGVLTLSGDERKPGPYLVREFNPEGDFEFSLDVKAETLGEVSRDPMGAGEGFQFGFFANLSQPQPGFYFELRARAGGQFLLVWHDDICDLNGWGCNWDPFVYNALGYNDGYDYWHPEPLVDLSNSTVKPDVWYTMKLKVQKEPFVVTGEVYDAQGLLLGFYTVDSINNMSFDDIKYVELTSVQGGTFQVRNIQGLTTTAPAVSPTPTVVSGQNMFHLESNSTVSAFAFNSTSYELSFNVTGKSGTTGYVKLIIAKTLLPQAQNLKIQLDGKQLNYTLIQTEDSWLLEFNYNHSTHQVTVNLPKTAAIDNTQAVNPASSLTQSELIIATSSASVIFLLFGLLLVALKKR